MINGDSDRRDTTQSALLAFAEKASGRLSGVRNGILIFDQDPTSDGDIDLSVRNLQLIRKDAVENSANEIVSLADQCEGALRSLLENGHTPADVGRALDMVAKIEERLLSIPLGADDFLPDISGFVDQSFDVLKTPEPSKPTATIHETDFDLDDETMEIFRSEASELIENIKQSVYSLGTVSDDREALWEVRRSAHTFKGAAGIVGFRKASELAHRVEDLLDKLVESNSAVGGDTIDLLSRASWLLEAMVLGNGPADEAQHLVRLYTEFERAISTVSAERPEVKPLEPPAVAGRSASAARTDCLKPMPSPVVRVSLDRLDDLIKLTRALNLNHSALVQRFSEFEEEPSAAVPPERFEKLSLLLDSQRCLTNEVQEKLFGIRLVRFATLETRLSRAVHVTCQEEGKKAAVMLVNGDCEIDTQVIDAMIEPLLHLLKNAVVHGIEPQDRRRLIGKPEKGQIRVSVETDEFGVTLKVEDDGQGISVQKLKQKALRNELIAPEIAASLSGPDALELVFQRGLSTAEKVDLNAGRGIGMSIVKESIESKGGSISITSEPQAGTTFTIRMPLVLKSSVRVDRVPIPPAIESLPSNADSKLVLIVDDSASIRRRTAQMVEDAGHRAITATDGADAMELLLSDVWRPDLIFSDIEMPIMDGWEFLECVKNTDAVSDIPVVMVTSLDADEHRHRAKLLGAADYNVKPISLERVVRTLNGIKAKATAPAAG